MAAIFKDIEDQALQLSELERGELIYCLIVSLEGLTEGSPGAIAKVWAEEMARRVADMEAGCSHWIPAAEVMSRIRALISATKITHTN